MFVTDIDSKMPTGKYQGKTVREVWAQQPSYISWLHEKNRLPTEVMQQLIAGTYKPGSTSYNKNVKGKTMKNITDTIRNNVTEESLDMVQVHIGRTIYDLAKTHAAPLLPKFTWYEKLFTSKAKRETATLLAVYLGMHLLRTKIDHYALECLTVYINYELQATAFGTLNATVLNKLLTAPEVK